jgi:hypothetical protein
MMKVRFAILLSAVLLILGGCAWLQLQRDPPLQRGALEKHDPAAVTHAIETHPSAAHAQAGVPKGEIVSGLSKTEPERMRRMAENLLKPELAVDDATAARVRSQWAARFDAEHDPLARMEIVTEMPQLDDALTVHQMLKLLQREEESGVRQQIVLILGFMRTTVREIGAVAEGLNAVYQRGTNSDERTRIVEVLANLPTPESAAFIHAAFVAAGQSPFERIELAAGLFKLAPRVAIDPAHLEETTAWLQQQAAFASDARLRLAAARVLAAPGRDHRDFLAGLLARETDPKARRFLTLAAQPYPTR